MRFLSAAAAVAAVLVVAGCGQPSASSSFKPTATFQDLMVSVVDPAADQLWNSVSTEITKAGVEEKQPHTDEEWLTLRHQAVTLVEAANLLVIEGRPLVAPSKALDNMDGYLNPDDIQKAIDRNRPAFVKRVHDFQDAAVLALAAVDARKPAAVIDAGARIQQACELCHLEYWYPNGGPPALADLARKAAGNGH